MYSVNKSLLVTCIAIGLITNSIMVKQSIFFYDFDQCEEGKIVNKEIEFKNNKNLEENIQYTLQSLFDNDDELNSFIPFGVKITNILYINGSLEIQISRNILNYGGTATEDALVNQILATVFDFEEINEFTLFIEDNDDLLVEGTSINKYTRNDWEERMKTIEEN
ncbi:hypothetical protein SH1V18_06100 [Vallitalea longa]|uniref:GerMN domain-containing protein n=1 Tax=Vallitalea longa TaxID=2936439 RepID=A0A9W5Y8V5_9FIRM|nr:GerMN domain-containing protein [Vallitalea longa]GKX28130.1 hypothetical protein SH1V18_06100 [Vallitalea longa]